MPPSSSPLLRRAATVLAVVSAGVAALPTAASAQGEGALSATNGFYTVNATASGSFGALTGASHSAGEGKFLTIGGDGGRNMLHSYSSGADYRFGSAAAQLSEIPHGVRQEFSISGADDLLVQQDSTVAGTSETDSVVRFALRVENRGSEPVRIGARTAIDFMIGSDDGPRFAPQGAAPLTASARYEDPAFATFALEDDDLGEPTLRALWSVDSPALGTTAPDLLTMDDCCIADQGALVPPLGSGGEIDFDNEVYWIWGSTEDRARIIKPGASITFAVASVLSEPGVAPVNTTAPTVSGSARVGEHLTAEPGTWKDATALTSYAYEWLRCDTSGAACEPIGGATDAVYAPDSLDVGHRLRVRVTTAGAAGPATSEPTAEILPLETEEHLPPGEPTVNWWPGTLTADATPRFEFYGQPGGRFECSTDGGAPVECSSPFEYAEPLADGEHTLSIVQVDDHELRSTPAVVSFRVDTTPPATPILLGRPDERTTETSAVIEFAGAEGERFVCKVDDANFDDCESPLRLTDLPLGDHAVTIIAVDKAGNGEHPLTVEWRIDPVVETPTEKPVEEPKDEPKPEPTDEPKPEPTDEPKPEPTDEPKPEPKDETKPEPKDEPKDEPKPEPKSEPKAQPAPEFTATVGNKPAAPGDGKRGQSGAAVVTVQDKGVDVGCRMTGVDLASCRVDLYAEVAGKARASARVLVGTGIVEAEAGTHRLAVRVELNATGRALMRRSPAGLEVRVAITGRPVSGAPIHATSFARLVPETARIVLGGYRPDEAGLPSGVRRTLRALAGTLEKGAVVRITGHTDDSAPSATYLRRLGARRASVVQRYLAAQGAQARYALTTRGAADPVASNATKAGRARNRRVVITVTR